MKFIRLCNKIMRKKYREDMMFPDETGPGPELKVVSGSWGTNQQAMWATEGGGDADTKNGHGQPPRQCGMLNCEPYEIIDPFESDLLPDYTQRRDILVDTSAFKPVEYFKPFFPDSAIHLIARELD